MNIIQKATQAITARAVGAAAAVKAATRKFTSFLGRKETAPDPHAAEIEAYKRALWAIDQGIQNPEDGIALAGMEKAREYLNRSAALAGKGKLQNWNRQQMAERWIASDYSTKTGQKDLQDRRLETFNANFGINLSKSQYNSMRGMIHSPAFQKLLEVNRNLYQAIYNMVGEQIEKGADPVRLEQVLDLFARSGTDNFEDMPDLMQLSSEDFHNLYTESGELFGSFTFEDADEIERRDLFEGIVGKYVRL